MKRYLRVERFPLFRMTIAVGNWTCICVSVHWARPQSVKIYTTLFTLFLTHMLMRRTQSGQLNSLA